MRLRKLLFFLFFLSGFSALVYEVVWARQLGLVFGNTVYAVSTILTIFFAGLALGSLIFGWLADRKKKLLLIYAILELGIGIYATLTPFMFKLIEILQVSFSQSFIPSYSGFSIATFSLSFLGLIMPTTLMGGTLPLMARFLVRSGEERGGIVGNLYGLNTLGAVLGAFLAGFFLIPNLGVKETIWLAAGINLLIGIIILAFSGKRQAPSVERFEKQDKGKLYPKPYTLHPRPYFILLAFALAGFAALALEVLWTRVLILTFGSSTYAFSTILTVFLLGVALGSFLASKFLVKKANLLFWLAGLEIGLGVVVILLTPLLGKLPLLSLDFYRQTSGFMTNLQIAFLFSFLIILLPTLLMGAAFPLVVKILSLQLNTLGQNVGKVYSVNTFGGILGSLVAGFVFIPLFGLQKGILLASFGYFLAGILILLVTPVKKRFQAVIILVVVLLAGSSFFLPGWNKKILSSGVFVYFQDYLEAREIKEEMERGKLLFYKEGLLSTIAVFEKGANTFLRIDGKTDASTATDLNTELLAGHLPLLFHKEAKEVLVIGLGSGITLGAVEQYADVEKIDVVEIEKAVVEAAGYFTEDNHQALDDKRANLILGDGRNFLLTATKNYDIISSEPSNPWVKGNASLFTKEYFQLAKERLKDDGIFLHWVHINYLSKDDLQTAIATFQTVFPDTTVWSCLFSNDLLLVGTKRSLGFDFALLEEKFEEEKVSEDLLRIGIREPAQIFGLYFFGKSEVEQFVSGAKSHTDNHPILEFSTPKSLGKETVGENLEALLAIQAEPGAWLTNVSPAQKEKIKANLTLKENVLRGKISLSKQNLEEALDFFLKALGIDPKRKEVKKEIATIYFYLAERDFARQDYEKAKKSLIKSAEFDPNHPLTHLNLGAIYFQEKNYLEAAKEWGIAKELDPGSREVEQNLNLLKGVLQK